MMMIDNQNILQRIRSFFSGDYPSKEQPALLCSRLQSI